MRVKTFSAGLVILALSTFVAGCSNKDDSESANGQCVRASDSEIDALFTKWNDSLQTGDAAKVAANYRSDAVLLPTLSDEVANTPEKIREYFVGLLQAHPKARIDESFKKSLCNIAYDVGRWTINANGQDVHARYTYVYEYENGGWLIAHHHSSVDPA